MRMKVFAGRLNEVIDKAFLHAVVNIDGDFPLSQKATTSLLDLFLLRNVSPQRQSIAVRIVNAKILGSL
jgi:hypothetical protein